MEPNIKSQSHNGVLHPIKCYIPCLYVDDFGEFSNLTMSTINYAASNPFCNVFKQIL